MLNYKIEYLKSLVEYFNNFESIECKQEDVPLLNSVIGDLEELKALKEEIISLKVQLEVCKHENEGLRFAYKDKIRKELGYGK